MVCEQKLAELLIRPITGLEKTHQPIRLNTANFSAQTIISPMVLKPLLGSLLKNISPPFHNQLEVSVFVVNLPIDLSTADLTFL